MQVVRTAYSVAKGMGASDKVMLALFEAGIVESNFENLGNLGSKNDHDSLGYLQQRPSQGWPSPMDVSTATRSFVSRAIPIQDRYATAGQLAQAVQRSAFPLRYDAVKVAAASLLSQASGMGGVDVQGLSTTPLGTVDNVGKFFNIITQPGFWIALACLMGGFALVLMALTRMSGVSPQSIAKGAKVAAVL